MLRQLSVFAGGFTLEAAGAVAIGAGQPEAVLPEAVLPEAVLPEAVLPEAVLPLVSSLADKSLIVASEDDTGDRFRMLETIRDYAAARLLEAGEAVGAQARHFGFFARAVDRRPGEDEDSYCERLRADYDNIRVALGWASRQDAPELLLGLATRLVVFWSASTHLAEAVQWLRSATERGRDADPGLRARALGALAQIASLALDLPVAFAAGTEGLAVLRQLGDKEGMVMTLTSLGFSAEGETSLAYLTEAIALAEEIDDRRALAYALAMRGRVANTFPAGRPTGREALRRSIEVARQCGARHVEGIALGDLGVLSALDGRPRDAIPPLTEALPLLREAGDVYFLSLTLLGLVLSLSLTGDYDAALAPSQELDSISGQLGTAQLYFAPCARGVAAYFRGDWPEAIRSFREQLALIRPGPSMDGMYVGRLAWAEFLAGQQETARGRLDEFIASSDPARISLALPWAVRAVIARASGEHERAAELAQQAVAAASGDPFGQSTPVTARAGLGEPHADRARRGPGGGRRTVQPADRRPHVHLPAYRHHAPDQHLPQARHLVPGRARRPSRPPRRSPEPGLEAIVGRRASRWATIRFLSLLDAKPVARGVAHGGVADAPGLLGRLLQHLDSGRGGDLVEGRVEVVGAEVDRVQLTLGENGREGVPVLLGAARVRLRQYDRDLGLAVGDEGDPAEAAEGDLVAHLQPEGVAVEAESGIGVVDQDVHGAEGNGHGTDSRRVRRPDAALEMPSSARPWPPPCAAGSRPSSGRWACR